MPLGPGKPLHEAQEADSLALPRQEAVLACSFCFHLSGGLSCF